MQAAFEAGLQYAQDRVVFGRPVFDYQLNRAKVARMAFLIQAGASSATTSPGSWAGARARSRRRCEAYVCRAAEWVTREAMQLHGGMGYAEEFPVSRYFVTPGSCRSSRAPTRPSALRVIARRLAEDALART